MAAGGYRVDLDCLRTGERGLRELSDHLRDDITEPLAPPTGHNQGFASAPAVAAAANAWEAEARDLASVVQAAGDALAQTTAEYDRADASSAHEFERILRGG